MTTKDWSALDERIDDLCNVLRKHDVASFEDGHGMKIVFFPKRDSFEGLELREESKDKKKKTEIDEYEDNRDELLNDMKDKF